jgi:hypothetical protein
VETASAKPTAYQAPPRKRLGLIVALVAIAHVIVIGSLLLYLGLKLEDTGKTKQGDQDQAETIIPVTLERSSEIAVPQEPTGLDRTHRSAD